MGDELRDQVAALYDTPIWCGRGRDGLLIELAGRLRAEFPDVPVAGVKEKLGELRVHTWPNPSDPARREQLWDLLQDFREQSTTICEICGQPGTIEQAGWWSTLCPEHRAMQRSDPRAFAAVRREAGA